ncbi:MAG TPA: transglutaminase domain-containing protein [Cyclobacteriaceae bacterium]|nr:transglutaminase domain-containing protein [Cyclobacteriaceae bacterium]
MKNTLGLFAGIFMLCISALAQKAPIKFGDIPMEDMKMKIYPLDSGAEAVVLADFGESVIEYNASEGFQINFERIKRVKILKPGGTKHAEFMIPLYHNSSGAEERLSGLKVVTYNLENGKIVETKVKNDNFMKEKYDQNVDFMKGAWTNVKEGSVIEYTYRVKSDFLFNFQDWEFQSDIPIRWSEYRARIPEYFNYQKYMQGYIGLTVNENSTKSTSVTFTVQKDNRNYSGQASVGTQTLDYREENFRWATKDVPAFKEEPYITTTNDYISKINFELAYTNFPGSGMKQYMGSWEDINTAYWQEAKESINSNAGLKDDVAALTASATNDEQKAVAIYEHVKRTVLWDERNARYASNTPRKTMDQKKGSSAEINLLLACMLDKAGIAVNPVLLSTRDHGFVRENIPISSQFNYVVCLVKIGTKSFLLDATDRLLPFGVLPERCLNGSGLIVSDGPPNWISLNPSVKSRTVYTADLKLTEAGEVNGTLKIDKIGYHSVRARRQYHVKGESEYLKKYSNDPMWTVSNSKFENAADINLPFKEIHDLSVNEVGMASAQTLYFNPFIVAREQENPFKSESRQYPVDFGNQFEEMYMVKFTIPDGYVVEELPPSKVINLPEGAAKYIYNLSQAGNTVNLTSGLYINRSLFTQDSYPNLREFYALIIAKQSEQIVLKKK